MDNRNKPNENLGVNRLGKIIKKIPNLHQQNFPNPSKQQPEPHVYNISKKDFRSIVQQLTGLGPQELPNMPLQNPTKPQSERLQKIRPPPLTPLNRPTQPQYAYPNNTDVSPVSAYMHYLQESMLHSGSTPTPQATAVSPVSAYMRYLQESTPRGGGGGFPLLPSPNSQFPLASPSSLYNLLSPRYQFPTPPSLDFTFSPLPHLGVLGHGTRPPHSPGTSFPLSPSGFFPMLSPRWRGQ